MAEKILYGRREAAAILSISLRTLDGLVAAKQLPVRRVGRRTLFPRQALEAFARRDHRTQPVPEQCGAVQQAQKN